MVTTSTETPSMKLSIEVIPSKDLLEPSRRKTLRTLSRLINDTFALHGHPKDNGEVDPGALFTRKRLIHDEELVEGMHPTALTAIVIDETLQDTDTTNGQSPTGMYGNIVATGSVMPFKAKLMDLERAAREALKTQTTVVEFPPKVTEEQLLAASQTLKNDTATHLAGHWNWEIKLCSSSDDPRYRGKGLMIRCVDALVAQLKSQQAVMRKNGDPTGNLPIKLWSTSLEGTGNTEYWIRRGFEMVGEAEVAPAGTWTSTREISISTLSKVVS